MKRGFEVVPSQFRKNILWNIKLPERSTKYSAGYDFFLCKDINIKPVQTFLYWTDICANMLSDEVFKIYIRSSIAIKKNLIIKNQVGIIDHDYFGNKSNHGNIAICLINIGDKTSYLDAGEKIAQGIFQKYLISDNDSTATSRIGGIGSTN